MAGSVSSSLVCARARARQASGSFGVASTMARRCCTARAGSASHSLARAVWASTSAPFSSTRLAQTAAAPSPSPIDSRASARVRQTSGFLGVASAIARRCGIASAGSAARSSAIATWASSS